MPTLKLTNLAAYKQYWSDIATKHKLVDKFYYGDKDIVENESRSNGVSRFLWATPYDSAQYTDVFSDNVQKKKKAKVAYFKKTPSNKFADIDTTYQDCEAVIEDIISKIIQDKRGQDVSGTWTMVAVNISAFKTQPVEEIIGSSHFIGCELEMEFGDNTNLAYDATKWNP